jgi:hypothetical protein
VVSPRISDSLDKTFPMDPAINPLNALTFIVAPAILTNASSVMTMGISNRFARAVDRVRMLTALVGSPGATEPEEHELHMKQLVVAERRTLLLVRSLSSFYLAVGSFAAAALLSLFAAIFLMNGWDALRNGALSVAMGAGTLGVGGLVVGSAFLVVESRMTLKILKYETNYRLTRAARQS